MRTLLFLLLVGAIGQLGSAQNWQKLNNGMSRYNNVVFGDSIHDKLLIGGSFLYHNEDSTLLVGIAAWDGNGFDSLAHRVNSISDNQNVASPVWRFDIYQEQLYVNGAFSGLWQTNDEPIHVAKLNDSTQKWDPLECMLSQNSTSFLSSIIEDTMYFTAYERLSCGLSATTVHQYDGQQLQRWEPFDLFTVDPQPLVGFVFKYLGDFYMTGHLYDTTASQLYPVMRLDGNSWVPVPEWQNTGSPIKDFLIHDGKLYLAGYFREVAGAPGNCVAMYDGNSWQNMGGGMLLDYNNPGSGDPIVLDLWVHNDEIYAVGEFNWAGDIPASNIAKWNGTQWCSLGGVFNDDIRSVTTWRDTLYVGGFFETIDNDTVNYLAKWTGGSYVQDCSTPVGLEEHAASVPLFSVSPNPTNGSLQLERDNSKMQNATVRVLDLLGRTLMEAQWPGGVSTISMELGQLPAQMLVLQVQFADGQTGVRKVLLEQ